MEFKLKFFLLIFSLISIFTNYNLSASEGDTYSFTWLDPDKEVYVLQNRKFRKKGRFFFNVGVGLTTSGAFVDSTLFQGRAGYFVREEWGFEFLYSVNKGKENDTAATVRNKGGTGSIPFRRITDNYMGGMLLWSPFYAKINTFNSIIYYDWIIGVGVAKLEETNNQEEFLKYFNAKDVTETHTGLMWDMGLKFYINRDFDIKLDITTVHYKANKPNKNGQGDSDWNTNWDLALSFGCNF